MTDPSTPNSDNQVRSRQRGWYWPLIIVGMLLGHASLMIGTIIYVGGKNDTYVDPDYYSKAVDWDHQRGMMELADKKGWDVSVSASPFETDPTQRYLEVQLLDQDAAPITDAIVRVECFNPNEMSYRLSEELKPLGKGRYAQTLPIERPGIWSCKIIIQRFGETALVDTEFDVLSATPDHTMELDADD